MTQWVVHAMLRPGADRAGQEIAAIHASYVADRPCILCSGTLLYEQDGPVFGHFFLLEAESRAEVDRFIARHPFRQAHLWRQVLTRPMIPDATAPIAAA